MVRDLADRSPVHRLAGGRHLGHVLHRLPPFHRVRGTLQGNSGIPGEVRQAAGVFRRDDDGGQELVRITCCCEPRGLKGDWVTFILRSRL